MSDIALFEPEIPGNAGNVARLCAATGSPLHLIGRLGFSFRHPEARRAAIDYWAFVDVRRHVSYDDFLRETSGRTLWMFTTRAERTLWDVELEHDAILLFGPESRGLPDVLLSTASERTIRIPMASEVRSLNLGTAVAVALYEALRQDRGRGGASDIC